ncbi:hypothetical protein CPB83DRAFT_743518, partial [Crepidotus variabilis]
VDLTPKRHHGYAVILFIAGTLFPPLAVAARFGIGKDFWLNLILTICGYIPGHVHNFYIQNIRNNKTHARTPKWVQKYGLVDTAELERKKRKSQWANRYNDRLPHSALEGQALEEGQEGGSSIDLSAEGRPHRQGNGELWRPEDENYYNEGQKPTTASSGRWRYPANFEDAEPIEPPKKSKKKKDKKDRWERTQDAYSMASEGGSTKKRKKKKRRDTETASSYTNDSGEGFPEDAEGGLYGERRTAA